MIITVVIQMYLSLHSLAQATGTGGIDGEWLITPSSSLITQSSVALVSKEMAICQKLRDKTEPHLKVLCRLNNKKCRSDVERQELLQLIATGKNIYSFETMTDNPSLECSSLNSSSGVIPQKMKEERKHLLQIKEIVKTHQKDHPDTCLWDPGLMIQNELVLQILEEPGSHENAND